MSDAPDGLRALRALLASARVEATQGEDARPSVARIALDVRTAAGESGVVLLSIEKGSARVVDDRGDRSSPLVDAALAWLAALSREEASSAPNVRVSVAPRASIAPHRLDETACARALSLSLVRSGIVGMRRGVLDEPIQRARAGAGVRLARWIARLEAAVAEDDVTLVARLALGALRAAPPPRRTRVDLRLVEVAREHLDGRGRRSIERRYLVDLEEGSPFVEERERGEALPSLGPMPRTVEVGFAEERVEPGRASLLIHQYTTSPDVPRASVERLVALGRVEVSAVLDRVDALLHASPGFAEPLVLTDPLVSNSAIVVEFWV